MKYSLILFLGGTILLSSCSKMLETTPTDFLTQATYWKEEKHALEALTGCYNALTHDNLYNNQTPFMFEVMSPNAYHKDNYLNANDFATGTQSATTTGMNLSLWTGCYRGIGRCNTLLDNIGRITMEETTRSRVIGEAKFLRAFYYQLLNELFNGVPLVLSAPNAGEQAHLPRNTYAEVLTQILKDLDDAAAVLPAKHAAAAAGRATSGAALALKARVLLQNRRYEEVITLTEKIISSNVYGLFADYNGLFKKANEGNKEILFDVRFKFPEMPNIYDIVHGQYNTQTPTQELVDKYQMKDGKAINESPLYSPASPYKDRDPRFAQTIVYLGSQWRNKIATEAELHQTGYAFKKFTDYTSTTVGEITNSQTNYVVIRYADVLLMHAEAINELSGPDSRVYEAVNAIRQRPTVNMPALPAGLDQQLMREAIRLERRIELAGEGSYFYDIRRWKTIEQEMNGDVHAHDGKFMQRRKFNPARDYFWPIPFTEIDLNPALKQNENY